MSERGRDPIDSLLVSVAMAFLIGSCADPAHASFAKTLQASDPVALNRDAERLIPIPSGEPKAKLPSDSYQTASTSADEQIWMPEPREPLTELMTKLVVVGSEGPMTSPDLHSRAGVPKVHIEFLGPEH